MDVEEEEEAAVAAAAAEEEEEVMSPNRGAAQSVRADTPACFVPMCPAAPLLRPTPLLQLA